MKESWIIIVIYYASGSNVHIILRGDPAIQMWDRLSLWWLDGHSPSAVLT